MMRAMPETRPPDAMPTEWTVVIFARDKGFGTLRHASGEEVVFDFGSWDLGDWKPPPGASALPQPGEPVRVEWRQSASGKNVPRIVRPIGRVSAPRHTLSAWLSAVKEHTGHFSSLTPARLIEALARLDEDLAEDWGDGAPRHADDFGWLLMSIAHLAIADDWIYADDHRWDRERARARFHAMLGLPPNSVATGTDEESISEYAKACNAAAASKLRLHEIALDGDEHVFVCLPTSAFEALETGGYVRGMT